MRVVRVLLSVVGLAILTTVIAMSCLVIFIDPNKMKPILIQEVMAKTGYQMAIEGNFSWSFYPLLGVKIERMTLSEPKQTPFIDLHNITVATDVSQLLHGIQKLQGNVHISDVKLMNVHATDTTVGLHWQNKILTLQPVSATLYDGSLQGSAVGTQLSNAPAWQWNLQFNHVSLNPLMLDLNGGEPRISISGFADLATQMTTQGMGREQMINHLNGVTKFNVSHGSVQGLDLNYFVKTADDILNHKEVNPPAGLNQTIFDNLTGTINVKNGVAETNDLLLTSSAFSTKGSGTVNLNYHAVNLQLQVLSQDKAQTQFEIPVLVTGSLNKPDVRLDMLEIQKHLASQQIDKIKEKVNEQVKKISGKTGEMLQNLLGQ